MYRDEVLRGVAIYEASLGNTSFYSVDRGVMHFLGSRPTPGRLWTHLVPMLFPPAAPRALLFYEQSTGTAEMVYPYLDGTGFQVWSRELRGWPVGTWTHIVPGTFGGPNGGPRPADEDILSYESPTGKWHGFRHYDNTKDLLLFDANTGSGGFYRAGTTSAYGDAHFKVARMRPITGWRSWTQIVPGMFGGHGLTDLLLFEASTGTAEFYTVKSDAKIELINSHSGWPTGLQIVPGSFGESGMTDLLLYDRATGVGEFYEVSGGTLVPLNAHTGWRQTWDAIVPGDFTESIDYWDHSAKDHTGLLFFDRAAGVAEVYATDHGRMSFVSAYTDWQSVSILAPFDSELNAKEA